MARRVDGFNPASGTACVLSQGSSAQFVNGVSGWYRNSTGALVADVNGTDVFTVSAGGIITTANPTLALTRSGAQSIATGTATKVSFTSATYNPQNVDYWNAGEPYTITYTGTPTVKWLVTYSVYGGGAGTGVFVTFLAKNELIGISDPRWGSVQGATATAWNAGAAILEMSTGDILRLYIQHTSAGSINAGGTNYGQAMNLTIYQLP